MADWFAFAFKGYHPRDRIVEGFYSQHEDNGHNLWSSGSAVCLSLL